MKEVTNGREIKEQEESAHRQIYDALDKYKNGKLTLSDASRLVSLNYVEVCAKQDPANEDLAVLAAIVEVLPAYAKSERAGCYVDVSVKPANVKAAEWFCKQDCYLIIRNVSSAADLQTFLASSAHMKLSVRFEKVIVPFSELSKALSNQGSVRVEYVPGREAGLEIRHYKTSKYSTLFIRGVKHENKEFQAQQKIEQLIQSLSESGDFELMLENGAFDASLDLSINGLRKIYISVGQLTTMHIDCLRRIPANRLEHLTLSQCHFESDDVKRELFSFLVTLPGIVNLADVSLVDEYNTFQARYKKALEDVKAMIVRLEADPDDLQYEEFSDVNCRAIFALAEEKNSELCKKSEFKKLFVIASIVINKKIDISDERFRVVQWIMVHANRELPNIYVKNVDEACALIAALELNTQEKISAVIKLAVNDTHSVTIDCTTKGTVALSMTGVPQNADVFNKIVNSVSSTVRLEFSKDQFLPDMDLSNPGINSIRLTEQNRDQSSPRVIISADHVEALTKTKQLISFDATDCDFDSPQTKEAFVDAVLGNETLQELVLSGCGLAKKHIDKITAYAKNHPDLILVVLTANAYREGEDKELIAIVCENKACADKKKAREEACNTYIQSVKKSGGTFEETKVRLEQSVRGLNDFYLEPECVAAYVEALQECVKKMSFSDLISFTKELKSLDQLLSLCENLSVEEKQSVLDSVVARVVTEGTDAVLVKLLESNNTNAVLLDCQRKRFDVLEQKFSKAVDGNNFLSALVCLNEMLLLIVSRRPSVLFQNLYRFFLQLADLYLDPACGANTANLILKYLESIPLAEAELYQQAEEKIKQVFCKLIKEILLFDSKTETSSKFQEKSLSELSDLANNPKVVLQDVLNWMKIFIDDSSKILFREKYITNRGDKVDKLEQLSKVMKPYIRTAIPCAPTKTVEDEKLIAAAVLEKEREQQQQQQQQQQQKPAAIYPPVSVVVPDPVGVPAPQQYYVPPVAYPPAAPIPRQATYAELMAGQRGAESNPVLQGVVPAQAPAPSAPPQEEVAAPVKRVALKTMLTD